MKAERNETERLCLIANPRAAGGATGRRLDEVRRLADRWFASWELRETEGPGHATELAASAADFDVVAAVGGDGTAHEVVNGLFEGDRPRGRAVFTVIPAGTGSDLVKTLRISTDLDEAFGVAAHGDTRASDVMLHAFRTEAGDAISRIGVNITGFGIQGDVVRLSNQSDKRLGPTATFLGATLRGLASWRGASMDVRWTDAAGEEHSRSGPTWNVWICNGEYQGGGMRTGRGASMHDGVAKLVLLPPISLLRATAALPRLYSGRLEGVPGVEVSTARVLHAVADRGDVRIDIDGEQPGVLPLELRVIPGALPIRGRW